MSSLGWKNSAQVVRSGRSAAWLARLVRDQEVEGSNPFAPTTFPFLLMHLRNCYANVSYRICSARSAINVCERLRRLRLRRLRKLEAESYLFCPLLPVLHVLKKLASVSCAHIGIFVPHPKINQDLATFRSEQHGFTESAERSETDTSPSHPFEDFLQAVTVEALGRKHLFASGLEEEALFAIPNEGVHHSGECRAKIDVTIGGIGL